MTFRGYTFANKISLRNMNVAIILFSIMLITIMWVFLFLKMQDEKKIQIQHAVEMSTNFVYTFKEHSLRSIKSADQVALFIKYQFEREGHVVARSSYIRGLGVVTDPYVIIKIANENGDLIMSSQEPLVPYNILGDESFQVHQAEDIGKAFISKPTLGRYSGKWSIQITRRINNSDGSFGGVVIVYIDPLYFTDFYDQVNLGKDAAIGLVGHDGIIRVWQSNHQSIIGKKLNRSTSHLLTALAIKDSGHYSAISSLDNIKRIYSYQSLPDYQLAIAVGISEGEILTEVYQRLKIYYMVATLLTLSITGFCAMLIRNKRLETEFIKLERLHLIGEMAAGIGHEVRNPMTTVRGFLQLLSSKPQYSNDKEYFKLMIEELDSANLTITEYLALSKDRAVEKISINLNEIITRLLPLIKADTIIQDKDVIFNMEEIPDLLLDEKQIRQLILNIVRNGLEAMSPGGKLTIRTFMDNLEVVMAIKDDGKGIEPHLLDKLGTPFFTTKDYGTGLGLAVCYSIASRHNASIKITTTPVGTTFFIRFKI